MQEINETGFDSSIKGSSAIVEFFTDWCAVCKTMEPALQGMSKIYGNDVKFLKINAGKNINLAQKFAVMSVPTFLFIKDGRVIDQVVGFMNQMQLKEKLNRIS